MAGGDRHRARHRGRRGRAARRHHRGGGEGLSLARAAGATIDVKLRVGAGAQLAWLPQETILFDRARLHRRIDVDLAGDASLLMAEAVVFGRSAMGETVRAGRICIDRWRVRRDGRLVFAETVRLDGAIADKLAKPAVAERRRRDRDRACRARRRSRGRARARAASFLRRGRRIGLERACGGAALRQGWRGACARDLAAVLTALGGAAAAALAQLRRTP